MIYQTDPQTGERIMSEVWKCPECQYTTNVVSDRQEHRRAHSLDRKDGEDEHWI